MGAETIKGASKRSETPNRCQCQRNTLINNFTFIGRRHATGRVVESG